MSRLRVRFTFPPEKITAPVIYTLGKNYNVVTNIRRANITKERGWVMLELEGEPEDIERGIAWVKSQGVSVDPVGGDVLTG